MHSVSTWNLTKTTSLPDASQFKCIFMSMPKKLQPTEENKLPKMKFMRQMKVLWLLAELETPFGATRSVKWMVAFNVFLSWIPCDCVCVCSSFGRGKRYSSHGWNLATSPNRGVSAVTDWAKPRYYSQSRSCTRDAFAKINCRKSALPFIWRRTREC